MPSKDHSLSICHLDFFSLYVTDPALGEGSVSPLECDSINLIGVWDRLLGELLRTIGVAVLKLNSPQCLV